MSTERENEALLRYWFEEVWNKKQPELIAQLFAPDSVAHGMGPNGTDLNALSAVTRRRIDETVSASRNFAGCCRKTRYQHLPRMRRSLCLPCPAGP